MAARNLLASLLASVVVVSSGASAQADPLLPGDTLRVSFNMSGYIPPPAMDSLDVLQFLIGLRAIEPIGSFTTRVFNGNQLAGTYTAQFNPNALNPSYFVAPGSIFTLGNPTLMDFSAFRNGTFNGAVEFTIDSGRAEWNRTSEGLVLGVATSPTSFINTNDVYPDQNATWVVIPASSTATPEPGTLVLLGLGAVGLRMRNRGARLSRRSSRFAP